MNDTIRPASGQYEMTRLGGRGDEESGPRPDDAPGRAARAAASAGQFFSTLSEGAWGGTKTGGGKLWDGTKALGSMTLSGAKSGGNKVLDGSKTLGNMTLNVAKSGGSKILESSKTAGKLGWQGAKFAGKAGWQETAASAADLGKFTLAPLQNKAWGALSGHALQQMITCGLPTMAREEAFIEAYNQLLPHLVEKHPTAAVTLQAVISLANVALQHHLREPRLMRQTEPDAQPQSGSIQPGEVAVRGQFGLSPDQANVIKRDKPAEWARLSQQTVKDSKRVSGQQVMAEVLNVGMSLAGVLSGNPALTARVMSTQLRNVIYAGARESLQATGSLVASRKGTPGYGVNDDNMSTNAAWYTLNTLAMGMLQDGLIQKALPKGYSVSGPEIRDAAGQRLTGKALHEMGAIVSALRSACNAFIETGDAFLGKHYDSKQVGDTQKFAPSLPMKDYARLLDHSIARLSWNNFANSSTLASQQILAAITKGHTSPVLSSLFNNAGTAAAFGLTYKMVNQIYQAHSKVRGAIAAAPAESPAPPSTTAAPAESPAPVSTRDPQASIITDIASRQ